MKRIFKLILVTVLMMTLLTTQFVYGQNHGQNKNGNMNINNNNNGNENGKNNAPGQLKKIERYTQINGERIEVNNNNVSFDTAPVIQEGRTLIPVRAVTEALGCTVVWESPKVYIVSPDEDMIMVFNMSLGSVYVFEDEDLEDVMDFDDDDDEWEDNEVEIDVEPGIIDDRTFVPLRFISETLGLSIKYDDETGIIDIFDDGPTLESKSIEIEDYDDLPDEIEIVVDLNGFEFEDIEDLEENEDYTIDEDDDRDELTITILEDYIEDLDEKLTKIELEFEYEDDDDVEATKLFKIILSYMNEIPKLDSKKVEIDEDDDDLEVEVEIELNDYTLEAINYDDETLDEDDDYELNDDGDEVTFAESFLEDLEVGDHELEFEFERGEKTVEIKFIIEVED